MASAKFLEEALSTEVDESAVTALMGTLETQLVTATPTVSSQQVSSSSINQNHMSSSISNGGTVSTQKHGVTNGGSGPMNILLNSDTNKTITSNAISNTSNVHSNVNSVVASMHGGVPASGYINQVTTSQPNLTHLSKPQESVKIVYPTTNQQLSSAGTVNLNNRVTFTGASLPNGNIGLAPITTQTIINAVNSGVQSVVSHTQTASGNNINKHLSGVIGVDSNKSGGQALVIKTSTNPNVTQTSQIGTGVVSVPMSVNSTVTMTGTHVNSTVSNSSAPGMSGVVTLAKPMTHAVGTTQAIVGNNQTIIPANVQIVNVNAVRPGTPGQPGQKTLPPRVVIGTQHMVGGRPTQGITLQALQGLQPGTQGHLILKTENGQYQLLRVGPAPTQGSNLNPNNSNTTTLPAGGTFRLQTLPAQPGTVTVNTTPNQSSIQQQQQQQSVVHQSQSAISNQTVAQKHTMETTKEKCRKFLANLLELSSREPKSVEKNVRTLIQELIDTKVEPEEFCDRLERLLNASPQPCLIGFLKKSLPLLRQSLVTKELVIDGIRPPLHTVVFSLANSTNMVPQLQQTQIRPSQVRLVTPLASQSLTTVARPGQTIQHRLVTPVRAQTPTPRMITATSLRPHSPITSIAPTIGGVGATAAGIKVTSTLQTGSIVTTGVGSINTAIPAPPLHIRQTTQVVRPLTPAVVSAAGLNAGATSVKHLPGNMQIKTTVNPTHIKLTNIAQNKQLTTTSIFAKTIKQEKKTFSTSAGYSGEDDINDVAAMGGVNLAEETQRILGSTEFVGTQIRSCKDEIFLHSSPLQQKIRYIVAKHGLEEPTQDVAALISHACQERLKNLLEKLAVIAEHRIDLIKMDSRYEVTQDVKSQLKFLEELDKVERKKHEEQEREILLRAAKSRSKSEDPEQAKLKAKAKEMQRAEMEELRQREANLTALQAIGPRKKPKLEFSHSTGSSSQSSSLGGGFSSNHNRSQLPSRPRLKRVNFRDLLFLLEQEKETCRTPLLYKSFLK